MKIKEWRNIHVLNYTITTNEQDKMNRWGKTEAIMNNPVSENESKIKVQAEKIVHDKLSAFKGKLAGLKVKISHINKKIEEIKTKIKEKITKIDSIPLDGFYKSLLFRVLPGIIYVIGDIMFSMELIVKGWGLGLSNPFEKWILGIAIGLAPFFIKEIFDRIIEPLVENGSEIIKKRIQYLYSSIGIIMMLMFLQLAYMREVIFKYTKIQIEGDLYNTLFENHDSAFILGFIGTAFMFVLGGGILLSVGVKDISRWYKIMSLKKTRLSLENELKNNEKESIAYAVEISEIEAYLKDSDKILTQIDSIKDELQYCYLEAYHIEKQKIADKIKQDKIEAEERKNNRINKEDERFHLDVRRQLDMINKNEFKQNGVLYHD
jgi:hypothetical protein